jgi:hypothetical protein
VEKNHCLYNNMGLFSSKPITDEHNEVTAAAINTSNIWKTVAIIAIAFGVILLLIVAYFLLFPSSCPVCDECIISTADIPKVETAAGIVGNYKDTVSSLAGVNTGRGPIRVVAADSAGNCPYEDDDSARTEPLRLGKGIGTDVAVIPPPSTPVARKPVSKKGSGFDRRQVLDPRMQANIPRPRVIDPSSVASAPSSTPSKNPAETDPAV